MGKINRSFFIAWSIIAVLVFANVAVAATTVGTSITTAGDITTTGSGALVVAGTTTLTGLLKAVNASVSGDFELTDNDGNIVALGDLTIEDITASGSLGVTGATTLTGLLKAVNASVSANLDVTGVTTLTGLLSAVNASVSSDLELTGILKVTGATTLSSTLGVTGLTTLGYASASGNFEVGSNAGNAFRIFGSSGNMIASGSATIGYTAASGSGFVAQFVQRDNTATLSVDFDSGNGKGSCLQLRDTAGAKVYCRVNGGGTAFLCGTTACNP